VADTEPITIHVAPEAARAYNSASAEARERLEFILRLRLLASTQKLPPLLDLMEDTSRKAQERGLTPEILEGLLREE
jgi:hypothetical protein